jgi:alpha-D-xyloside xylohydrolase
MPPTEPWEYGEEFTEEFRRIIELRYRLMPYVYAQARLCSEKGYPMLKPLFFEYPEDLTCWTVEDEYMFGEDLLVAPLMEEARSRNVYLPPGRWVDYQSTAIYEGTRWHRIAAGGIPVVMLVRQGKAIPRVELAQSTDRIDWSEIELAVFGARTPTAEGLVCLPEDGVLHPVRLKRDGDEHALEVNPLQGRAAFRVVHFA